ncbi:MAG TPA: hypothetical protein PK402_06985 [Tepidisphaeraceae bacterium]|nr:hypothetical protein [Tepidisphaeraceae bacterium]
MFGSLRQLDDILRGQTTRVATLREHGIRVPVFGLTVIALLLGAAYGGCMGIFSLTDAGNQEPMQIVASAVKVPLLFLLTLIVTLPSLYVFNALVGSRLHLIPLIRLMVASMSVTVAVLASLGPIVAFFSISSSYAFIVLLNVAVFGLSGLLGISFLLQTLHRLSILDNPPPPLPIETPRPSEEFSSDEPLSELASIAPTPTAHGALDRLDGQVLGKHVKTVFRIWMIVFAFVGTQMGWLLRPFVGSPGKEFEWFRPKGGNFFSAVWALIRDLFDLGAM